MRPIHRLVVLLGFAALAFAPRLARADDEQPPQAEEQKAEKAEVKAAPRAEAAPAEAPAPAEAADAEQAAPDDAADAPLPPDSAEYKATFAGIPTEVGEEPEQADGKLAPTLSADQLREMAKLARDKVLARMQAKMKQKAAERMGKISAFIFYFSLLGVLLLGMPLVLAKRFPGQGARLFKYSALAAVTFFVTVNLFGCVVLGFRTAQSKLGDSTNPQLAIASAFFDTIGTHAEDYLDLGKQLFAPTLNGLQNDGDEQPAAVLLENGKKLIKDGGVFVSIANAFKKLDIVFAILPTILLLVTMILFVVAIKPTLVEIVKLPMTAGAGGGEPGVGRGVVTRALRRVGGELLATLCTLGVLVVLTLLAGTILGRVVGPALDALIGYFTLGVIYMQSVASASSALVFVMLIGVILFLLLNLVVVIASMSIYLGKSQKIFQRRWNDGVPLAAHARFWKWGSVSVVVAQLVPWLFILIADWGLDKLDEKLVGDATDASQIPWSAIMLLGPILLVAGFVAVFWAARGLKSVLFLAKYKVPPATQIA